MLTALEDRLLLADLLLVLVSVGLVVIVSLGPEEASTTVEAELHSSLVPSVEPSVRGGVATSGKVIPFIV